jgi:type II secretory pathway pseudopilin PulG
MMKDADRAAARRRSARGFALIDLLFVCFMIGILSMIALPGLMTAKTAASAASAMGSMRTIGSSQLTYALTCGGGFYAPDLVTLGTAPAGSREPFIGGGLGTANSVIKANYRVQMAGTPFAGAPPTCNGLGTGAAAQGFKAAADPLAPGITRFFGTNANGVTYEYTSSLFGIMPEVGEPPAGKPIQ